MKIRAYFFFPETDEHFLRIGDNPQSYRDLIDEILIIRKQLKNHGNFELCYNSSNVNLFLTQAELLIDGEYLSSLRTQLRILFNGFSRDVSKPFLRKEDCVYALWSINCSVIIANELLSEASESKITDEGQDKTIVINISEACRAERDNIHIIKDAIHHRGLPLMITVPITNNEVEFLEWYSSLTISEFSLNDKNRFQTTAYRWKKQPIYREIASGNFWYFDYFHKDNNLHYEVFNPVGIHLGEANTAGVLDTSKADGNKKISNILQ